MKEDERRELGGAPLLMTLAVRGETQENESDCQVPSGKEPSINHRKPAQRGEEQCWAGGGGEQGWGILTLWTLASELCFPQTEWIKSQWRRWGLEP